MFKTAAENQLRSKIVTLFTDNGGEYVSKAMDDFLAKAGIEYKFSAPHTTEQNGLAERLNRTLQEKVRVLLLNAALVSEFWQLATETAVHIYNRCAHISIGNISPYELWFNRKPKHHYFRIFGFLAFTKEEKTSSCFAPQADIGIMVGYSGKSPYSWKIYSLTTGRISHSRKVQFMESKNILDVPSKSAPLSALLMSPAPQ